MGDCQVCCRQSNRVKFLDLCFAFAGRRNQLKRGILALQTKGCIFKTTKRKIVEDTMKNTTKTSALTQTTEEYASRSSIHGIGYIFDRELNIVDRFLWLFVVLSFAGVAAALTWNFWSQWRNEQVI